MFKAFVKFLLTILITFIIISCNEVKQVQYYYGESKMYVPNEHNEIGRYIGSNKVLIKRTIDPQTKEVIEQVVTIYPKRPPQEFLVTFQLKDDDTFDTTEQNKAFYGHGKLFGEKWKWKSWESESFLPDNSKIVSKDSETEASLNVKKFYYAPDGKLKILFIEEFSKIDENSFITQYNTLFPKK